MIRPAIVAVLAVALVVGLVSAQGQRPAATLDDLLAEVRGLRGEVNRAAEVSTRAQLLTARLALQEGRIGALVQQLASVRQQISETQMAMIPFATQMKGLQADELAEPLRAMFEQMQKRDQGLRAQEGELSALVAAEQNRWLEFNARLDEIERGLAGR